MNSIGYQLLVTTLVFASFTTSREVQGRCCGRIIPLVSRNYLVQIYPTLNRRLKQIWTQNKMGKTFYNREKCLPSGCYKEYYLHPEDRHNPCRIVRSCDKTKVYFTETHYKTFFRLKYPSIATSNSDELFGAWRNFRRYYS